MIDDYRPFSYSPKNWGNKFGLLFGGYWVDPFRIPDTDLRLEYTFVNQYAYTHATKINAYTHFNSPIGHQIGTDADDLWLNLKHWFTPNFTVFLSYELERHGKGDVNIPHEGKKDARDDDEWEFLSGVTESTHSITLGASYNLIGKYSAALEYTHSWVKNAENQADVDKTKDQLILSGQYRF
jgi:predicted porin